MLVPRDIMEQAERDQAKRDICARHGIALIEITPSELDFDTIAAKISETGECKGKVQLLPLRLESPLVRELAGMCENYAAHSRRYLPQ